jgi:hypothetical protein
VGSELGRNDGLVDGATVGTFEGIELGLNEEGVKVGAYDGTAVGNSDTDGAYVGDELFVGKRDGA